MDSAVAAKTAEETPLIAQKVVGLMIEAGIPSNVIQLFIDDGAIGAALTANLKVERVCFIGTTEVAELIDKQIG